MPAQDYSKSINAKTAPEETIKRINQVAKWWAKNFQGKANALNDTFTVRFGNGDMYKLQVTEIQPNTKLVWQVVDAHQGWVKKPTEWVGTKLVWQINETKEGSEVHFTHSGLVPDLECFKQCTRGWNYLMLSSLTKLLNEGEGAPA